MAAKIFQKQFIGVLGQSSISKSAFNVATVCLTWYVFTYTGSATYVGIVAVVQTFATILVSLPVGTLVDRHNKALLLIISGLIGFFTFLVVTIVSLIFSFNLVIILSMVALWGAGREISRSASLSLIPDMVEPWTLSRANGIFRAINSSFGSISNAAAGIVIVVLGVSAGFAISSGAYLSSSVVATLLILPFIGRRVSEPNLREMKRRSMLADLSEGFLWLVKRKGFFLLTICATFFNFFMDMAYVFLVVYVVDGAHATSIVFGFALAALAAGDVIGSLIPGRVDMLKHTGKVNVLFFGVLTGFAILIAGLFPSPYIAVISPFILGLSLGIGINLWLTTAHNLVPSEMRGRYFALDGVLSSITPVGIAAGAVVISLVGIINDFIISGVMLLATGLIFSLMRSLWKLDGRARPEVIELD